MKAYQPYLKNSIINIDKNNSQIGAAGYLLISGNLWKILTRFMGIDFFYSVGGWKI